jgi:integrase
LLRNIFLASFFNLLHIGNILSIKPVGSGYQVDIMPGGRGGKRVRKTFKFKAEALAWERHIQAKVQSFPDWTPPKKDIRLLSELVDIWFKNHGIGLRAGSETHRSLLTLCKALNDPTADGFTVDMFTTYRTKRMAEGTSANTLNHEHAYLRSVFNELIRMGLWKKNNPLKLLRPFKLQERELSYLKPSDIKVLLTALDDSQNVHLGLIARICLATGARWGEAEQLTIQQIRNGMIQFARTKSGKVRNVPISSDLETLLLNHHKTHGAEAKLFTNSRSAFAAALSRTDLKLEQGQMTHVLRHTFASHFIMATNDILSLQKILGHADLKMTMRYAHLAKGHLDKVIANNPLAALTLG